MRRGQSMSEFLVLLGVVTVIILPLIFFARKNIGGVREAKVIESMETLKKDVITLTTLGPGSARRLLVVLPQETEVTFQNNNIIVNRGNQEIYAGELPVSITGNIDPGTHYVNLFFDGRQVIVSLCGNDKAEQPVEECDGFSNSLCNGRPCNGDCKCSCTKHDDCNTGICRDNACQRCVADSDCPYLGSTCVDQKCTLSSTS